MGVLILLFFSSLIFLAEKRKSTRKVILYFEGYLSISIWNQRTGFKWTNETRVALSLKKYDGDLRGTLRILEKLVLPEGGRLKDVCYEVEEAFLSESILVLKISGENVSLYRVEAYTMPFICTVHTSYVFREKQSTFAWYVGHPNPEIFIQIKPYFNSSVEIRLTPILFFKYN